MNHPIIIAAFGSTSRARNTYDKVHSRLETIFPDHDIHWAYSSRIVRHKMKHKAAPLPSPRKVMENLAARGHAWAVVQSFNMICGHEFHRLREDVLEGPLRVSIGHSLLCGPDDFEAVAVSLSYLFEKDEEEAVVLAGHGTDHCAWTAYPVMEHYLRKRYGIRAFFSVIEGEWQNMETVVNMVSEAGFKKVRLAPFMLVAGVHFEEDLAGGDGSYKAAFEKKGIHVSMETEGQGTRDDIIDLFAGHIKEAMDVIPCRLTGSRAEHGGN